MIVKGSVITRDCLLHLCFIHLECPAAHVHLQSNYRPMYLLLGFGKFGNKFESGLSNQINLH